MSRKLDALVAERVMGWTVNRSERHWHTVGTPGKPNPGRLIGRDCCADKYHGGSFCPSRWIVDAMEALETAGHGVCFDREAPGGEWDVSVWPMEHATTSTAQHEHPATALCIALLRASGADEAEIAAAMEDGP